MSVAISPGQLRGPLSNLKWFLARQLEHFPEAMSTHCHSLSFPASFSLFPRVCVCVRGEKSSGDRGKLKSLAARVSSRHEGLSLFCRSPAGNRGTFFLLLIQVKSLLLPLHSLSQFLRCTPWLPFTSWCLLNVTYFTWGTLWRWGIRSNQGYYPCGAMSGPDALRHPSSGWPLLQRATSRGIKWHYGGSGWDRNSMGSAGRTLLSLGL